MIKAVERPILRATLARATLAATHDDPLLYAAASLILLAGLRSSEVGQLLVHDWAPGWL
ncbi:hypothetical protein ACFV2N_11900 [Streptomyces sp. NPDC059680]|uniref:hypothetical protein n=1 Tax=Streptomyces sp. NPDC059680 TaxID=3346904 RepID=UPI0036CA2E78